MKFALVLTAIFLGFSSETNAQVVAQNCASRDAWVDRRSSGYGETRQAIALGFNNTLVETFANLSTGTWSIIVTTPGGASCLVAAGGSFQLVSEGADPEA